MKARDEVTICLYLFHISGLDKFALIIELNFLKHVVLTKNKANFVSFFRSVVK